MGFVHIKIPSHTDCNYEVAKFALLKLTDRDGNLNEDSILGLYQ